MQCAYQMPVVASLYCYAYLQELLLTKIVQVQNIPWIASSLKVLWYGSIEWNIEENFIVEWNMEWKIFSMEWKWNGKKLPVRNMEKSSSIPFHTMPCLWERQPCFKTRERKAFVLRWKRTTLTPQKAVWGGGGKTSSTEQFVRWNRL